MVIKTTTTDGAYTIDTYTGSGTTTFTVPARTTSVTYLVVAGGGSGGNGSASAGAGGGGGAGGFRTGTLAVTPAAELQVVVGAGGTVGVNHGVKGADSVFSTITAIGGGYGGYGASVATGGIGGSGGGAGGLSAAAGGAGTSGQGYAGGSYTLTGACGAGGGGSGAVGATNAPLVGGAGGAGTASSISGSSVTYASGGNGGDYTLVVLSTVYAHDYVFGTGLDESAGLKAAITAAYNHPSQTLTFDAGTTIVVGSLATANTTQAQIRWGVNGGAHGINVVGNGATIKLADNYHTNTFNWQWMYLERYSNLDGLIIDGNLTGGNINNTHGIMLKGNNIMNDCTVHDVYAYGILTYNITPPTNISITNCTVSGSHQYGITTGCTDGSYCYGTNVTITGCTITGCKEVGIKIRGTVGATITGNTITLGERRLIPLGDTPSGIRLYTEDEQNSNINISDNIVIGLDEDPSWGIKSDDMESTAPNTSCTIHGNTVSHCHHGILLYINGGIITDNTISDCTHPFTSNGTGNTISGNVY